MSSVMFFPTIECRFSIIWFSGRAYFAAERIGVSVVAIDPDKPIQGLHWWLLAVTWQPNVALPIWCSLFETLWPSTDWRLNYITLEFFIKASMDHKRSTKATILWFTSPGDKLNKLKPFLMNSFGFFFCDTLYNVYGPGPLVPALAALASSSSVITEFRWYEKQTFFSADSCTIHLSQKKLFRFINWVKTLRRQLCRDFKKSQKILGLDFGKWRDRDFEIIPRSRDISLVGPGTESWSLSFPIFVYSPFCLSSS